MIIDLTATIVCHRCDRKLVFEDVIDFDHAERKAHASGWCECENGEDVCDQCWAKYDAEQAQSPAAGRVPAVDDGPTPPAPQMRSTPE